MAADSPGGPFSCDRWILEIYVSSCYCVSLYERVLMWIYRPVRTSCVGSWCTWEKQERALPCEQLWGLCLENKRTISYTEIWRGVPAISCVGLYTCYLACCAHKQRTAEMLAHRKKRNSNANPWNWNLFVFRQLILAHADMVSRTFSKHSKKRYDLS